MNGISDFLISEYGVEKIFDSSKKQLDDSKIKGGYYHKYLNDKNNLFYLQKNKYIKNNQLLKLYL